MYTYNSCLGCTSKKNLVQRLKEKERTWKSERSNFCPKWSRAVEHDSVSDLSRSMSGNILRFIPNDLRDQQLRNINNRDKQVSIECTWPLAGHAWSGHTQIDCESHTLCCQFLSLCHPGSTIDMRSVHVWVESILERSHRTSAWNLWRLHSCSMLERGALLWQ